MYISPMETGVHPDIYESELLDQEQMTKYQMSIGSEKLAVPLGQYDIQYTTNNMAWFEQQTREGHMNRAFRIFVYLNNHLRAKIHFYPQQIST